MILADTSVWIAHFRFGDADLAALLGRGQVLGHAFVIGELACGLMPDRAEVLPIPLADGDQLVALLDRPDGGAPIGLVLVLHGLGGSSDGPGPRRLALALAAEGFAVLRLNLRGAGRGRSLARGTYCALCNEDLRPAVASARQLAADLPLFGAGISLGGTVLLNAGLGGLNFDGLVSVSSPLDLGVCAVQFERRRNRVYQRWLMQRLREQTLADPGGLKEAERQQRRAPSASKSSRSGSAAGRTPGNTNSGGGSYRA